MIEQREQQRLVEFIQRRGGTVTVRSLMQSYAPLKNQKVEAEAAARKAVELQPTAAGCRRWLVFVAIQRGDGEAAMREAELEPNERYRHFELALAHHARGTDARRTNPSLS